MWKTSRGTTDKIKLLPSVKTRSASKCGHARDITVGASHRGLHPLSGRKPASSVSVQNLCRYNTSQFVRFLWKADHSSLRRAVEELTPLSQGCPRPRVLFKSPDLLFNPAVSCASCMLSAFWSLLAYYLLNLFKNKADKIIIVIYTPVQHTTAIIIIIILQ